MEIQKKKRGRPAGTVVVDRPDIALLALAQLDSEAKQEVILRTIAPKDRKTPNGLGVHTEVKFNCGKYKMHARYPNHNLSSTYVITKILYPFESSTDWYECILSLAGELMGYVNPDDLQAV